jgi:type IV secretion system protein VirB6
MLTLGLVLTFATSWVAYQSVVWSLLTGGPDQIAAIITGQSGSATAAFAQKLDELFGAVAAAAEAADNAPPAQATEMGITPAPPQAAGWTPGDVLWMAAMLLLLGTVGVLLVARIALAVLLAVGPVFIVFALFRGTHGLFVGWLKGAVMFALVPLFTVLVGGAALALLAPVVAQLNAGAMTMRPAVTMFLGAAVYVSLMVMVMKVSAAMVAGWRLGGGRQPAELGVDARAAAPQVVATAGSSSVSHLSETVAPLRQSGSGSERVRAIVSGAQGPANDTAPLPTADRRATSIAAANSRFADSAPLPSTTSQDRRAQGIGATFRPPAPLRKPQP